MPKRRERVASEILSKLNYVGAARFLVINAKVYEGSRECSELIACSIASASFSFQNDLLCLELFLEFEISGYLFAEPDLRETLTQKKTSHSDLSECQNVPRG
jgi:hypothetical protein